MILEVYKQNQIHHEQTAKSKDTAIYIIKNLPDKEYMQMYGLEKLTSHLEQCNFCRMQKRYPDIDDAYQHLQQFHAQDKNNTTVPRSHLAHWLVSTSTAELEANNERMLRLIGALNRQLGRLLLKASEIRISVANEDNERSRSYLLPADLVKAAEKIFQLIYTSSYSIRFLYDRSKPSPTFKYMSPMEEPQEDIALIQYFGTAADRYMSSARDALLLMTQTGYSHGSVLHVPTTPETTMLLCLLCLAEIDLRENLCVPKLYRDYLSSLVSVVCFEP